MHTNILTIAATLSDDDLLTRASRRTPRAIESQPFEYAVDTQTSWSCWRAARLARAENKSRREIEALVAELAPRPDVPSLVRKLSSAHGEAKAVAAAPIAAVPILRPAPRPVVEVLAPARYRVQFTIGQETEDKLRRLQALLRREIPNGDPAVIFDRAVSLLLEKVERRKLGKAQRPRPLPVIRPETDKDAAEGPLPPRDPPNAVKRAVWARDQGRCAYVSPQGRRCEARTFLEFHHLVPYGKRGEATVDNIALRCRRHNQFEAQLVFGDPETSRATIALRPQQLPIAP